MSIRYITAKLAQQIDEELMGTAGAFSIDQLMELAGLACAQTLATVYGKESHPRVLVCCGSGNQGGDGLVAARHLGMFGYKPTIWMPKPGSKDIYKRLHAQCTNMHIPTLPPGASAGPGGAGGTAESERAADPKLAEATLSTALAASDVVLDAIFGFSFKPPARAPFDTALRLIARAGRPVVSVDIPSGWDVERGAADVESEGGGASGAGQLGGAVLYPDVLLSLTAPKEGVRKFAGRHFLGGRFVPRTLEEKYELNLPPYPGFAQIVELPQRDHDGPLAARAHELVVFDLHGDNRVHNLVRMLREHEWDAVARGGTPSWMSIVRMKMIAVKANEKTMKGKHGVVMKRIWPAPQRGQYTLYLPVSGSGLWVAIDRVVIGELKEVLATPLRCMASQAIVNGDVLSENRVKYQ